MLARANHYKRVPRHRAVAGLPPPLSGRRRAPSQRQSISGLGHSSFDACPWPSASPVGAANSNDFFGGEAGHPVGCIHYDLRKCLADVSGIGIGGDVPFADELPYNTTLVTAPIWLSAGALALAVSGYPCRTLLLPGKRRCFLFQLAQLLRPTPLLDDMGGRYTVFGVQCKNKQQLSPNGSPFAGRGEAKLGVGSCFYSCYRFLTGSAVAARSWPARR